MSDGNEQHPGRPEGELARPAEFARLTAFAQRGSALAAPERIRVVGTRRLRRHRAGQAVLGTGALAAVVFLGTAFAQNGAGQPSSALAAGNQPSGATSASASASGCSSPEPSASISITQPEVWHLMPSVAGWQACTVEGMLKLAGYTHVTVKLETSGTIASGKAIDVVNDEGRSVLGHAVPVGTALTVLISTGPAH